MEVAIYIRVSTKLQEDKYSLEAQRLELTRYANEQKWSVVDIYKDVDSGGKLHKPGLEALMDAVDDNLIDVVLCFAEWQGNQVYSLLNLPMHKIGEC